MRNVFVLASQTMVYFTAMSVTSLLQVNISDTRYIAGEASSADQKTRFQRPEKRLCYAETPLAIETPGPFYQGEPKGNE